MQNIVQFESVVIGGNKFNKKELNNGNYVLFNNRQIMYYNKEGKLHRENDKPAIISLHAHGVYDRKNDRNSPPSLIYYTVYKWYNNGEIHRENNNPAVIEAFDVGVSKWYKQGKLQYSDYCNYKKMNLPTFEEELNNISAN